MTSAGLRKMAACLIWCWFAFQPFSVFAGVMYQKDYVVKQDQGNRIWCEPYVVQKNDSLPRVFREKGEIIGENPDDFLQIFKRLNPHVSNIETIRPGQQILIPLKKLSPDRDIEHTGRIITLPMVTISGTKTQSVPEPKPPSEGPGFTEYKIKPGDTLSEIFYRHFGIRKMDFLDQRLRQFRKINPDLDNINRIHSGQIIRMPIFDTASATSHEDTAGPLERIALLFQARLVRKGTCYFPMPGKADIKLDYAQFPLMEFSEGLRILFNPNQALTQNDTNVIYHYWPELKIIEVSYDASYQEILEQVLNVAPYLDEPSGMKQNVTGPELRQTALPPSSGGHVSFHGRQLLIERLMQILGVSYTQNVEISFPYAGVQISSRANWIESGKGKPILVDFGTFYGDAVQALEKAGFIVIQILDADSVYEGVSMLLNALAVSYSMDAEIQTADQPSLRIPGIWIERNGQAPLILTETALNHEMIQAVREKGFIVLTEKRKTG